MVVDGYPWLLSVIYGCGWLSMAIEQWLWMVIDGADWLSMVWIGYG